METLVTKWEMLLIAPSCAVFNSHVLFSSTRCDLQSADILSVLQHLVQCMCGNNMSVQLLPKAVTVPATEKETAAVSENLKYYLSSWGGVGKGVSRTFAVGIKDDGVGLSAALKLPRKCGGTESTTSSPDRLYFILRTAW